MSEEIRWRKTGGGSFRMKSGKIIKPNQTFVAKVEDIPEGFRDAVVPVTKLPEDKPLQIESGFELSSTIESGDEIMAAECEVDNQYFMVTETKDGDKEVLVKCTKINRKTVVFNDGEEDYKLPFDEILKTVKELYDVVNSSTKKRFNAVPLSLEGANDLLESLS